jgi:hypothetical protein
VNPTGPDFRPAISLSRLPKRLEKFGLQTAEEKSALVKFNRWEPDQSGKFTFLGFDFRWGRSRKNPQIVSVRRRTNRNNFRTSLLALKEWLKEARSLGLPSCGASCGATWTTTAFGATRRSWGNTGMRCAGCFSSG